AVANLFNKDEDSNHESSDLYVKEAFVNQGTDIKMADVEMIPKNLQKIEGKDVENAIQLLEELENHDDITNVYTNLDADIELDD
ncbi:MAG: YebC/PmpR family DNA-binding transcriptional regulator, partial [Candidatus Heimdallarchaeota archaeon]|nr:YebC/PmpR family DNA-binding transcriptional regulator [Candidatus Heimdallarchaeota archaeon]